MDSQRGTTHRVAWALRIGVAMEFIGHGELGLRHPDAWTPYLAVVGIPRDSAQVLMPLIGAVDIAVGTAVLLYAARGALLYAALWGLWTALLRPLAGESAWEAVERAGNLGAASALYLMAAGSGAKSWIRFAGFEVLDGRLRGGVSWVLRLTTAALLLGHGALGLIANKEMLGTQYSAIGLHGASVEPWIGGFETALAVAVLMRPAFGLLIFVFAWKLASEAIAPMAGSPVWVFVEHGGSYAAPLALAFLNHRRLAAASQHIPCPTA